MKIERTKVEKLKLTELDALDPITVILEDIAPRQGKIIIECYGQSWSSYWGGMGDRTISQFFCSCDNGYLIGNLSSINSMIPDWGGLPDHVKKEVIKIRRDGEFDKDQAREIWDEIHWLEGVESYDGLHAYSEMLVKVFGDDWWYGLPEKENPDYVYLSRIVDSVKVALKAPVAEAA